DRRVFMASTLALLAAPLAAEAQPAGKVPRIGDLNPGSAAAQQRNFDALKQSPRDQGYIEGQNVAIEKRFAERRWEQVPALATELANLDVDVFVVNVNRTALAAQQATTKIPIVMAVAEDPVGVGLVKSLARPGGNITGVTVVAGHEIYGKNLELVREVLPKGARIAVLFNTESPVNARWLKATEEAARKFGVGLVPTGVRSAEDFEQAFVLMAQGHARGVVILGEPLFFVNPRRLNDLAVRSGLASIWPIREGVDAGGLISYGANLPNLY